MFLVILCFVSWWYWCWCCGCWCGCVGSGSIVDIGMQSNNSVYNLRDACSWSKTKIQEIESITSVLDVGNVQIGSNNCHLPPRFGQVQTSSTPQCLSSIQTINCQITTYSSKKMKEKSKSTLRSQFKFPTSCRSSVKLKAPYWSSFDFCDLKFQIESTDCGNSVNRYCDTFWLRKASVHFQ